METKTEAIIIDSTPYGERRQVTTAFSQDAGLIQFMAPTRSGASLTTLVQAHLVLTRRSSNLYSCREASIINSFARLREQYTRLHTGCELLKVIKHTQPAEQPAPQLYSLLTHYLERLQSTANPSILLYSFMMKVLKYEGLLEMTPRCSVCHQIADPLYLSGPQLYCNQHRPAQATALTLKECHQLAALANSRSFTELEGIEHSDMLATAATSLFSAEIEI